MIKRELTKLTLKHCQEVMMQDILIGSAYTLEGKNKSFVFNIFFNEYRVKLGESVIDSGQAVAELLTVYNKL